MESQLIVSQIIALGTTAGTVFGALTALYRFSSRFQTFVKMWASVPSRLESVELQTKGDGGKTLKDTVVEMNTTIQLSAQKAAMVQEALNICEYACTSKGEFIYVSPALCRLLKCPPDDLIGWNWLHKLNGSAIEVEHEFAEAVERKQVFRHDVAFIVEKNKLEVTMSAKPVPGGYIGLIVPKEV